jgi:hypothetical protein
MWFKSPKKSDGPDQFRPAKSAMIVGMLLFAVFVASIVLIVIGLM